ALLAESAAAAFSIRQQEDQTAEPPVFVIGSEVPVPGGSTHEETLQITRVQDLNETLACFRAAFAAQNQLQSYAQVIAVVVQPGVEFGSYEIHDYDRASAQDLCTYMKNQPSMVLEGHSTDYQRTDRLREMAEDGIAILKVGPALTFALREGLIALEHIEKTLYADDESSNLSYLARTLDLTMRQNPQHWLSHYPGNEQSQRLSRIFSLSDRCRYYLGEHEIISSISRLMHNLRVRNLPLPLVSQYLPDQYRLIRQGQLIVDPEALLVSKIRCEISRYPSCKIN
ncbi:MAG TPA: tagatose-bisphosphate aldolase, partial [Clostridiales bacterium]|nr:tagatose-bisphosphate aldolase [Clostridiales bacterium]